MKLNQNFFWDKFLLIWGIIGMLFPVVVVMRFEVKGLTAVPFRNHRA